MLVIPLVGLLMLETILVPSNQATLELTLSILEAKDQLVLSLLRSSLTLL